MIKEAKEFASYMIQYHDYGRIDWDGSKWYITTPKSSFQIIKSKKGYAIWREVTNGIFFKQEELGNLTFALFRCYFRDYCKENGLKANAKLYTSFYKQFNSYLILKAIERMEIE